MDVSESDRALVVAEQKLDAIRKLHQLKYDHYHRHGHFKVCAECHRPWPCLTVAILDSDDTPREK